MHRFCFFVLATALNVIALPAVAQPSASMSSDPLRQQIQQLQQRLQDWAQLGVYHQANTTLPPPAPGENRVVFFGDSITNFWNLAISFPGRPYLNRGISGQTTPQMLIRFRPDVIELKPRVVVVLAGTNDLGGNTGPTTLDRPQAVVAECLSILQARS
jgi:acyl-CoA thioesterase-1